MEQIILNSVINATDNKNLHYNILSISKDKKLISRQTYSKYLGKNTTEYVYKDDFLIKYIILDKKGNDIGMGEHTAYLSEFTNKEQKMINILINLKGLGERKVIIEPIIVD